MWTPFNMNFMNDSHCLIKFYIIFTLFIIFKIIIYSEHVLIFIKICEIEFKSITYHYKLIFYLN
jgi:hypothetical protein